MVGAIWVDSGSDSDDAPIRSHHRQPRSQQANAVAGPSRLESPRPQRSHRRAAAPPSSASIIALSSSQDHEQQQESMQERRDAVDQRGSRSKSFHQGARGTPDTPSTHIARLLADASPDASLPSFRGLLGQHLPHTNTNGNIQSHPASLTDRAGSLRRTASQPVSSSQEEMTSSRPSISFLATARRARATATIPEVIEIGSDSIIDPASELGGVLSSPIRSQFSTRHRLSSSQPRPYSPLDAAIGNRNRPNGSGMRRSFRTESAPIVILSSSPPPASFAHSSQRATADVDEAIAEEEFDLPFLPPSSFPFEETALLSPPSSPIPVRNTSPSLKRAGTDSLQQLPSPKRVRSFNRTTSLLDALDSLYVPAETIAYDARQEQPSMKARENIGATPSPQASPSKTRKAMATEAREAKAREREAAKATKARLAAEKKRFLEVNRLRTSKADTMRELIVDLDRTLFGPGQPLVGQEDPIKARYEAEGASVHLSDGVVAPPLVRFRRRVKAEWNKDKRHWIPLEKEEVRREGMTIVYVDAAEIVRVVGEGAASLDRWFRDLKRRLGAVNGEVVTGEEKVFLICQGLVKYYSRIRANENRAYTARIRQRLAESTGGEGEGEGADAPAKAPRRKTNSSNNAIDSASIPPQATVERALLELKLIHRCYVIHAAALVDGIEWLHQLSSDLSLRPYKWLRDSYLSFAVDTGRNTTSSSSAAIYAMMLQQIPRVTPSVASSITTIYPSLQALIHAYQRCSDETEAKALLSGVQVQSNKDGTERRANRMSLGLQLSKRIHAVVRGTNADLLINNPTED